jgi:hypothetical protein
MRIFAWTRIVLGLLACVPGLALAQNRIFSAPVTQQLSAPVPADVLQARSIGIDGDSIIMAAARDAYLFRRAADGTWSYSRTLIHVASNASNEMSVEMKNFLAIVKIGGSTTIWEKINGEWTRAQTAAPITAPGGFAISTNRIMVGADGCTADALIYQKTAAGIWDVSGRIPPEDGTCRNAPRSVELNYDLALVSGTTNVMRSYRPNGSALTWVNAGNITGPDQVNGGAALQSGTLVLSNLSYYRRTSAGWSRGGKLLPLDYAYGAGDQGGPLYRDGVLLVSDHVDDFASSLRPYVYVKNSRGGFDHLGVAPCWADCLAFDISHDTIVTLGFSQHGGIEETVAYVSKLPADLTRPRAVVNNFDARDLSAFTPTAGSQYALAGNSYNYLYRQSNALADTASVLEASEWTDFQSIEADFKANSFSRADAWVGLAVRYVDANNYYFVTFGNDDVVRLQRKLNGAVTTLAQSSLAVDPGAWKHASLIADADGVRVLGIYPAELESTDHALTHGRVAVLTSGARADFDNLEAKSTGGFAVFGEDAGIYVGRPYTIVGGHWTYAGGFSGYTQDDTSGQALAINGLPMDDQSMAAYVDFHEFATTNPVAWYGVVARYVDPANFYYLSIRSSNQLQIRKMVNGVVTVLKAISFTPDPVEPQWIELQVVGNELTALVDHVPVARAVDDDIPRGRFGLGSYRTKVNFYATSARQP